MFEESTLTAYTPFVVVEAHGGKLVFNSNHIVAVGGIQENIFPKPLQGGHFYFEVFLHGVEKGGRAIHSKNFENAEEYNAAIDEIKAIRADLLEQLGIE